MDNPQNREIPNLGLSFKQSLQVHPHGKQIDAFVSDNIGIWTNDPEMIRLQITKFVEVTGISRMDVMLWSLRWISINVNLNQHVSRYVLSEWVMNAICEFQTVDLLGQISTKGITSEFLQRSKRKSIESVVRCVHIARAYATGSVKMGPLRIAHSKAKTLYESCLEFLPHLAEEPAHEERLAVFRARASISLTGAVAEATSLTEIPDRGGSYFFRSFMHTVFFVQFMYQLKGESELRAKDLAFDFAHNCFVSLGLLLRVSR